MKSSVHFLYKKLPKKYEFHENRLGENRALFSGVNEFIPIL
jgi:hypothetical protein